MLLLLACGDSIQLGSDIIGSTDIEVEYTDTVPISAKTISSTSPPTYRNSNSFDGRTYLVGEINDSDFGRSTSISYFSATLISSFPNLENAKFDSVVLSLPLDTLGDYGNEDELLNLELYQLVEKFEVESGDTLFSDLRLEHDAAPIATLSTVVNSADSIMLYNPIPDTILRAVSQIRFQMDTSFWREIANDTLKHESSAALIEHIKGFALKTADADNRMLGLRINAASSAAIEIYYSVGDTSKQVYFIDLGLYRHSFFEHDYSASSIEPVLDLEGQDELLYLQSMSGTNVEFDISFVDDLPDVIINKAVLEFVIESPPDDYFPISQVLASYRNDDGELNVIEDASPRYLGFTFDGELSSSQIDGSTQYRYEIILTNHINNLLNGQLEGRGLIITAIRKQERPHRSLLFGPTHNKFPATLNLITTKP